MNAIESSDRNLHHGGYLQPLTSRGWSSSIHITVSISRLQSNKPHNWEFSATMRYVLPDEALICSAVNSCSIMPPYALVLLEDAAVILAFRSGIVAQRA